MKWGKGKNYHLPVHIHPQLSMFWLKSWHFRSAATCPLSIRSQVCLLRKSIRGKEKEQTPVPSSAAFIINDFIRNQVTFYYGYLSLSRSWRMNKFIIDLLPSCRFSEINVLNYVVNIFYQNWLLQTHCNGSLKRVIFY